MQTQKLALVCQADVLIERFQRESENLSRLLNGGDATDDADLLDADRNVVLTFDELLNADFKTAEDRQIRILFLIEEIQKKSPDDNLILRMTESMKSDISALT